MGYGWDPLTMVSNTHRSELWLGSFNHGQERSRAWVMAEHSLAWVMAGTVSPWAGTLTGLGYVWLVLFHHRQEHSIAELWLGLSPWPGMLTDLGYRWDSFISFQCETL